MSKYAIKLCSKTYLFDQSKEKMSFASFASESISDVDSISISKSPNKRNKINQENLKKTQILSEEDSKLLKKLKKIEDIIYDNNIKFLKKFIDSGFKINEKYKYPIGCV
jgi:hypothetical protein